MAVTMRRGAVAPGDSGVDMDGVEEGPDPDGSDCDEIPTPVLLLSDACPCVRYPHWLGRRALSPNGVLELPRRVRRAFPVRWCRSTATWPHWEAFLNSAQQRQTATVLSMETAAVRVNKHGWTRDASTGVLLSYFFFFSKL